LIRQLLNHFIFFSALNYLMALFYSTDRIHVMDLKQADGSLLLFFTINQNPPLQESLLPPFGIISKSFIGLSCYMILVGIYSSITLLSRKNTLTNAVLKELSKDRLFGSVVRTEQEMQARSLIEKNLNQIEAFRKQPKELSKDEVLELVKMVKKEMSGQKNLTLANLGATKSPQFPNCILILKTYLIQPIVIIRR
jgi:hypothetical protein